MSLVFTDVQQSTRLWDAVPGSLVLLIHSYIVDAMSKALKIHDEILRNKLKMTGGYEVKTEGDSFMLVFRTPLSAVWWCLFVQQALVEADWPKDLLEHEVLL